MFRVGRYDFVNHRRTVSCLLKSQIRTLREKKLDDMSSTRKPVRGAEPAHLPLLGLGLCIPMDTAHRRSDKAGDQSIARLELKLAALSSSGLSLAPVHDQPTPSRETEHPYSSRSRTPIPSRSATFKNTSNSCSLTSTRVIVFILEPVVCLLGFPGFPVGMTAYKKL